MLAEVLQWAPDGWIWVYFISSSSVLCMEPDLGRWFIAGSLRRSWWGSSGRSDCRGTDTENVEKAMAPSAPPWTSFTCLCLCHTAERPKAAWKTSSGDVCTDCEGHHTNISMRDCLECHVRALLIRHPPQEMAPGAVVPALGSLKLGASAVYAPEDFTETFLSLVLLPFIQLCVDLRGLMAANKSVAFPIALWGLLSLLSSTENLVWDGSKMTSPVLAGAETACLGWGIMVCWAWELGWVEVMVYPALPFGSNGFCWCQDFSSTSNSLMGAQRSCVLGQVVWSGGKHPVSSLGRKKVLLKVYYNSLTAGI